jgi:hypothetical protein
MGKQHLDFLLFGPGPNIGISLRDFARNVSRLFIERVTLRQGIFGQHRGFSSQASQSYLMVR